MIKEYDVQVETFTIPTLIKFLQAAPNKDSKAQYCAVMFGHKVWCSTDNLPKVGDPIANWRWLPQPKLIDMSYMINNGVDCEFSNDGIGWGTGKLSGITANKLYENGRGQKFILCRPRMNEWLAHTGDKCPVPEGFTGRVLLRDGSISYPEDMTLAIWDTAAIHKSSHIIQFMITGTAEGYRCH